MMGYAELLPSLSSFFPFTRLPLRSRPTTILFKPVATMTQFGSGYLPKGKQRRCRVILCQDQQFGSRQNHSSERLSRFPFQNTQAREDGATNFMLDMSIGPEMFEGEALGLSLMYETVYSRASSFQGWFTTTRRVLHHYGIYRIRACLEETSTPQMNTWSTDWVQFYAEHRLGYQLNLAVQQYGDSAIHEKGQRLISNMHKLFEDVVIEPCLLHGDLWSGNISSDKNGEPVILDPACYYGHNEAEFGMSWCAGFTSSFYNAYFEVMPKHPGHEQRRDLYLLYHYLNHYNLFGSGYRSSCMSIIDNYLRVLKA